MRNRQWIIGIDEVGRGPLAGPITVAAVAAPWNYELGIKNYGLDGIRDSKKLSALQRKAWKQKICGQLPYIISSVNSHVIDRKGIAYAARIAVSRCLKKFARNPLLHNSLFLIQLDGGLYAPPQYKNQQTIIRGDEQHPLIAAASIVAKVHRDRYMTRLHKKFPQYGFAQHKGYGTKAHCALIKKHGLSDVHRASFCKFL